MTGERGAAFDAEAAEFAASLAEPWNRLKYELALANLLDHLPARMAGLAVLDAGGGTGEFGLRLVERGARLTLLDPSEAMLAIARERAARRGAAGAVRFVRGAVEALPGIVEGERFDAIVCHNVLEYVERPAEILRALAGLPRPGGVLSLLVMNSDALPLRQFFQRGDPAGALAALGQHEFTNRFGIVARTFPPAGALGLARDAGLAVRGWYGVRMFYDYSSDPRKAEPAFYDAAWRLELAARAADPYRLIGRDLQVIAE